MQAQQRNIALDLYRLLCMFLITTVHILCYSDIGIVAQPGHYNFYISNGLYVLQRFCITGFVLISAYFLVNAMDVEKKAVSFLLRVSFSAVVILLFAGCFNPDAFSRKLILKSVFPVLTYHYWYPVSYMILLLFAPMLNKFVRSLSGKELLCSILLLAFFVSGFFHINPLFDPETFVGHPSHGLIWFILLYLIAAYIRLHGVHRPVLFGGVTFLISGILLFFVFMTGQIASLNQAPWARFVQQFLSKVDLRSYNSVLSLVFSVSSFVMFLNFKLPAGKWSSRVVGFLAPTVFGIYLIQEHNAVRELLWKTVNIERWEQSPWFLLVCVLVFLCLWVGAVLLHQLYRIAHKLFLGEMEDKLLALVVRVRDFVLRK